jgi:type I restriction enzyme, R subunit
LIFLEKYYVDNYINKVLNEYGWKSFRFGERKNGEVIDRSQCYDQIRKLNPDLPIKVINRALDRLLNNEKDEKIIFDYLTEGKMNIDQDQQSYLVKLIDFQNINNNSFSYQREFFIKSINIKIDICLFINYLPVIILEFKNDNSEFKKNEAVNQIKKYVGQTQLKKYNLFNIIVLRDITYLGINHQSDLNNYNKWNRKEHFDFFKPEILLQIIQHYLNKSNDKIILAHQFDAINQVLIDIKNFKKLIGIIAHTTGTGKSYTMVLLAKRILFEKPEATIIVITDRTELEEQISEEFNSTNWSIFESNNQIVIDSIKKLKKQLTKDNKGKILFSLIQKFDNDTAFQQSDKQDIFIFVDEAHRTHNLKETKIDQNSTWANNMRNCFPKAFIIGFTATPIENENTGKNTLKEFGGLVDKYSMEQGINDGIIVDITYIPAFSKLPKEILKNNDILPEDIGNKINQQTISSLKIHENKLNREASNTVYDNPERIKTVVDYFKNHYQSLQEKLDFKNLKVMYNANSINGAGLIFKKLYEDKNYRNHIALIVSREPSQKEWKLLLEENVDLAKKYNSKNWKNNFENLTNQFKNVESGINIAIVVDKLTTGFNLKSLVCFYLDQKIQSNHVIFQKIMRVNRNYLGKEFGIVVDLINNSKTLKEAVKIYYPSTKESDLSMLLDNDEKINKYLEKLWQFFNNFPEENTETKVFKELLLINKKINDFIFFDKAYEYLQEIKSKDEDKYKNFIFYVKKCKFLIDKDNFDYEFAKWCFNLIKKSLNNENQEEEKLNSINPSFFDSYYNKIYNQNDNNIDSNIVPIINIKINESKKISEIYKEYEKNDKNNNVYSNKEMLEININNGIKELYFHGSGLYEFYEEKLKKLLEEYNQRIRDKEYTRLYNDAKLKPIWEEINQEKLKLINGIENDKNYVIKSNLKSFIEDKNKNQSYDLFASATDENKEKFYQRLINIFSKFDNSRPYWNNSVNDKNELLKHIDYEFRRIIEKKKLELETRKSICNIFNQYFIIGSDNNKKYYQNINSKSSQEIKNI